jgi:hypothetical protein
VAEDGRIFKLVLNLLAVAAGMVALRARIRPRAAA